MVWRDESLVRVVILLIVDGLIVDLVIHALEALRSVWLVALRLRKLFQSLRLAAHGALDLDDSRTGASHAVDGLGDGPIVLDVETCVCELFGGVLGLAEVLGAATTFYLLGKRNASETISVSVDEQLPV